MAGSGAVLFYEDFESGFSRWSVSGIGSALLVADGSQVFSINEMAGDQFIWFAGSSAWTDQIIEARVKVLAFNGTSSADVVAICGRLSSPTQFYYFAIQSDGKAKIKVNNGANSSLSSAVDVPGGFGLNTWYTLRLSIVGSTLTAYINGTQVAQVTDTALTNGAVGLMVQRAAARFDDVYVRAP